MCQGWIWNGWLSYEYVHQIWKWNDRRVLCFCMLHSSLPHHIQRLHFGWKIHSINDMFYFRVVCVVLQQNRFVQQHLPSQFGRPPGDHWVLWGWVWKFQAPAQFWWMLCHAWSSPLPWWWSISTNDCQRGMSTDEEWFNLSSQKALILEEFNYSQ